MIKSKSHEFNYPFTPLIGGRIKTLKRIHQHFKAEKSFQKRYYLSLSIACILEPFRISEKWITHRKIERFNPPEDPLFIIGHWRSGTTLLHNLLSIDKQFGFCSTYQSILPDLTLVHQTWLNPIMRWIMPRHRPADHVELNLNYPQEEEFALGNMVPWSFYYGWYFPQQFDDLINQHMVRQPEYEELINKWQMAYRQLIKIALMNSHGEIYLSKNPPNTFRLELLKSMFPNARYIFIIRNPYEVYESALRFAKGVLPTTQLQSFDDDCLRKGILNMMNLFFLKYESAYTCIKKENLVEVKYEAVLADPIKELTKIYSQLNLGSADHLVQGFQQHLTTHRVNPFRYEFSELTIKQINSIWQPIFNRFGYTKIE